MSVFAFSSSSRARPGLVAVRLLATVLLGGLGAVAGCDGGDRPVVSVAVAQSKLPAAKSARFVRLEERTEWNGNAWASVAEFNLIDATGATVDRKGWIATADSATATDPAQNAIDGDTQSMWHTPWQGDAPPPPHALTIDLGTTARLSGFRYLARQDKVVNGTIAQYRFYLSDDGLNWGEPVAAGDFVAMSAPTTEKTVIFAEQGANRAPVVQTIARQSTPMGRSVSLGVKAEDPDGDSLAYTATGLPPGLAIAARSGVISGTPIVPGNYAVTVSVGDNKAAGVDMAFAWSVQAPAADRAALASGEVRYVKLEEVSEVSGKPWASVAEFNLVGASGANLPRNGWHASADSADTSDRPDNAIDADPHSLWHTQWTGTAPMPPHSLIVDLGRGTTVRGFRYLPRQDAVTNGTIAKFRFYASADGVDWGKPLAEGDFSTMGASNAEKTVLLK